MRVPEKHNPELPEWPGASHCYSKAYRILEAMAKRGGVRETFLGCMPSRDMDRLIEALNEGNEEEIKGLLLMTHVYYE